MKSIKISDQTWSSENLAVLKFSNGDKITLVTNMDDWEKLGEEKKPACAYLAYDEKNGKEFGLLYNFYAVTDKRGLAPEGWHVPTLKEWELMIKEAGGEKKAGTALKKKNAWEDDDCSDSFGFSSVPSCFHDEMGFDNIISKSACYWTATKEGKVDANYVMIGSYSTEATVRVRSQAAGFSVRIIK